MVPAADVERAVDGQQEELLGRRPIHIPGLTAAALPGLGHGPLDRDDQVAEVGPEPGRQGEGLLQSGGDPGNASGGKNGNDRTSVAPEAFMWMAFSPASSLSDDRTTLIEPGPGAPAASSAARTATATRCLEATWATPGLTVTSIRKGGR